MERKKTLNDEEREQAKLRLNEAWHYLSMKGLFKGKTEAAFYIGCTPSNFSGALSGRDGVLTLKFMQRFAGKFRDIFNDKWLLKGEGEMLRNGNKACSVATANNSPNAVVNASYNGNILISDGVQMPNSYGDTPVIERNWKPVVPASMAKMFDYDVMANINQQNAMKVERLYSGTAKLDIWHYVTDNDLYPFYQKGDCLGLKAYEPGDHRIRTGNVYVVDTKRDGLIVRRFRLDSNGDFVSYTFNDADPQNFMIPKDDVIRVYSVVLMFRY